MIKLKDTLIILPWIEVNVERGDGRFHNSIYRGQHILCFRKYLHNNVYAAIIYRFGSGPYYWAIPGLKYSSALTTDEGKLFCDKYLQDLLPDSKLLSQNSRSFL